MARLARHEDDGTNDLLLALCCTNELQVWFSPSMLSKRRRRQVKSRGLSVRLVCAW